MSIGKLIPKQIHLPYVGALYELAGRVFFFVSIANFILNTRLYYYNTGDAWLRDLFGSYTTFCIAYSILGFIALIGVWVFVVPSQNKFVQEQSIIDGRSPQYDKICEIFDQNVLLMQEIQKLNSRIAELENKQ